MSRNAPSVKAAHGTALSVAIVAARYNEALVDALVNQVQETVRAAGVKTRNLAIVRVPGSNELPIACDMVAKRNKPDVIVALGVLIRGDTIHYELIARSATDGLQRVALDRRIPVINGVVVTENEAQAQDRCTGPINRGAEFGQAALTMAQLKRSLKS